MTEQEQQTEELRCIGCGSIIQTEDPNGLGYTPKSALEKERRQENYTVSVVSACGTTMKLLRYH